VYSALKAKQMKASWKQETQGKERSKQNHLWPKTLSTNTSSISAGNQCKRESGDADNASRGVPALSSFEQALYAARELWLGPHDGLSGEIGELDRETWQCEHSTEEAIREAQPTAKLTAFYSGIHEWQGQLCASATRYYNTSFELALGNGVDLGTTFSVIEAKIGSSANISSPAEFARSFTAECLSTYLRITALDGKEKAEIPSNGRVREFIRHVCGDYSDVLVGPDAVQNEVFHLPRWPKTRSFGSRLAQWPIASANGETSSTLSIEETEEFILGVLETLVMNLRRAIAHAHRIALAALGKNGNAAEVPSKTGSVRSNLGEELLEKQIIFDPSDDGWTTAQPGFSQVALLNSYESIAQTLRLVRIAVGQTKGNITAEALRERFRDSDLYRAAGPNDWGNFIDDFTPNPKLKHGKLGSSMPGVRTVALRFLARTSGLSRATIEKYCSEARKQQK
jgi:hypothetical protein